MLPPSRSFEILVVILQLHDTSEETNASAKNIVKRLNAHMNYILQK